MFDPQTTVLIQQSPELAGLDRQRLPEEFTKAFASIVSFRLHVAGGDANVSDALRLKLAEFRRLAATFEAMVTLLPERADRRSAAFVAAQAHHLLHLVRETRAPNAERRPALRADAIAPEVSALLLFLIANQPSDATEMARQVRSLRTVNSPVSDRLRLALCALAFGRLTDITSLGEGEVGTQPADSCDAAVEALYHRLHQGLMRLAAFLSDASSSPAGRTDAVRIFHEVQQLALEREAWPFLELRRSEPPPLSAFSGPHHLASLLIAAADLLGASALSVVNAPPGVSLEPRRLSVFLLAPERPPCRSSKATSVLAMGGAVIYLAPSHALVSQMKADLAKSFPSIPVRDSLLVDDFYAEIGESFATFDPQIVVMTPERCLALLSEDSTDFGGVRLVIFDECHLLHPKAGGQNRRSLDAMLTLLHLRQASPNADWLLLSAMMANADELAGWVRNLTSRQCLSLNLDWKPTRQARGCLVYDREELDAIKTRLRQAANKARTPGKALGNPGVAIERELLARPFGFFSLLQTWQTRQAADYVLLPLIGERVPLTAARSRFGIPTWYPTPNKNEVASQLAADCVRAGLKVLLFVQNTRDASKIAKLIGTAANCTDKLPTLSPDEQHLLKVAIEEMGSSDSVLTPVGCAGCHHANMLPVERELVESLFRNSEGLQALAATATLAQGMNLPADMVLIVGDERFDTELEGFAPLDAHELLNAAGRAGRAGLVAQGLVVVIPHSFVEFDPQTNTIGSRWTQLQESVFSRADQCLLIQDPIDYYLDRVQDAASLEDPEARYFLRRIPRGSLANPDASAQFLRTTLGGWKASRRLEADAFETRILAALQRRSSVDPIVTAETWRDELAYRTGIPVDFIEALHLEVLRFASLKVSSMEEYIRWFFGWLGSDPSRMEAVFAHRLPASLRVDLSQGDLLGGKLSDAVWGWMSGETLVTLNTRLGGAPAGPGKCDMARKFVLKMIPDLAFAAGLVTRIRRKQIDEAGGKLPLALATLALCIREGVSEPEIAAIKISRKPPASRAQVTKEWREVEVFARPRNLTEPFGKTRERVLKAQSLAKGS